MRLATVTAAPSSSSSSSSSHSSLLLLLLLQLLVTSNAAPRVNIVSDGGSSAAGDADTEQIEHLLADNESLISKLGRLKGKWPFTDESRCDRIKTKDTDYHRYIKREDSVTQLLRRAPNCGLSKLSDNGDRQTGSRQSRDVRHASDWRSTLKELESLVDNWLEVSSSQQPSPDQVKDHANRVVGGHITRDGAWPWLAAVGRKSSGPKCGGSLIADRWVVTAAHCFEDEEMPCQYNVRLGSRNWLYDTDDTHVDATVEAIYRHPDYDKDSHANDVALLKLSVAVELNENSRINAVCLPGRSRSVDPGTVCVAAGWGKTAETSKASVFEAREVDIPVITYTDKCGYYESGTIRRGMLCAGYLKGERDTCQGDSGGPLVYQRDDRRWTLLGLTSLGEGCARANYPGVYTDVGYHLDWIASVIDRF